MTGLMKSKTLSVSINVSPDRVYKFVSSPEKLRTNDKVKAIYSLDWSDDPLRPELDQLIAQTTRLPLWDDITLIELADIAGRALSANQ